MSIPTCETVSKTQYVILFILGLFITVTAGVILGTAQWNLKAEDEKEKVSQIKWASGIMVMVGSLLTAIIGMALYGKYKGHDMVKY